MSTDTSLDIRVVFDATGRRRPGKTASPARRRSRAVVWVTLGVLNCVAAGSAYYVTWWQVDPFLYMTFIMHSPLPGVQLSDVDTAFAQAPGAPLGGPVSSGDKAEADASSHQRFVGQQAAELIGAAAYSWLAIATAGAIALALAGGSLLGSAGGKRLRRVGLILLLGCAALLGFGVFRTLSAFGGEYPPRHLRIGMGAVTALALLLGLTIGRRTESLTRLAGVITILGGAVTAAALYVGHLCGAIAAEQAAPMFLGLSFVAVSAWGWLLVLVGTRWTR